jgi:hypothetical protein
MSLFGPSDTASLIEKLRRASPAARRMIESIGRTAGKYGSGPLVAPGASSRMGNNSRSQTGYVNDAGQSLGKILSDAAKVGGRGQPQVAGNDPLMDLWEQLIGQLQSPVNMPTGVDTEDLMRQVQDALNPIYDQRGSEAEARTGRARQDVEGMYSALSKDYERLAPQQAQQADEAQEQVEDLYGQLRSNIQGNYSRVAKEQGELFKELGIEAALPDVLESQNEINAEAVNAASQLQATNAQRYMDIGEIDETYYREGAPQAKLTGSNRSGDLLFELQNYLNKNEAERTAGIQSSYTDLLGQAQSQLGQQQQVAQSEAARRQEMLFSLLQSQSKSQQPTELTPDTFMSQLPPNVQQGIGSAFTRLQRSPEAVYGKTQDPRNPVPGTFVETTPEWYMAQADQMLKNGEIDQATHQALLMYMQLYFKMGS